MAYKIPARGYISILFASFLMVCAASGIMYLAMTMWQEDEFIRAENINYYMMPVVVIFLFIAGFLLIHLSPERYRRNCAKRRGRIVSASERGMELIEMRQIPAMKRVVEENIELPGPEGVRYIRPSNEFINFVANFKGLSTAEPAANSRPLIMPYVPEDEPHPEYDYPELQHVPKYARTLAALFLQRPGEEATCQIVAEIPSPEEDPSTENVFEGEPAGHVNPGFDASER